MTNILSSKEIIHCATPGIPKGMKKHKFISIASGFESSEEHKTNNCLKISYMYS